MAAEPLANILVVDDSEAICRALRDLLTMSGYTVRTAPSGERALQILETAPMDLVITDLKMSGISGIQLLKKIKEKTPALPVVILTGFGDMDSVIEAMRSGVADYLKKPFSVNEVLQVTERELKRSKQMQAAAAVPTAWAAAVPRLRPSPRAFSSFPREKRSGIDKVLSALRAETTAESVLLIEEAGHVISAKGMSNERDMPSLAALVVGEPLDHGASGFALGRRRIIRAQLSGRSARGRLLGRHQPTSCSWSSSCPSRSSKARCGCMPKRRRPRSKRSSPAPYSRLRPAEERLAGEATADVRPAGRTPRPNKPAERPESVQQLDSLFSAETMAAGAATGQDSSRPSRGKRRWHAACWGTCRCAAGSHSTFGSSERCECGESMLMGLSVLPV